MLIFHFANSPAGTSETTQQRRISGFTYEREKKLHFTLVKFTHRERPAKVFDRRKIKILRLALDSITPKKKLNRRK